MIVLTLGIFSLMCSLLICALRFISGSILNPGKAVSLYPLFIIAIFEKTEGMYNFLLLKTAVSVCVLGLFGYYSLSKHFVISLNIVFFMTVLILITFHRLKLSKAFPVI